MSINSCTSEEKRPENAVEMADSNAEAAEEKNDAKFDGDREDDATFLTHAAQTNMMEIELGRLAQKNAMSSRVKDLGKMMEKAHTQAQKDLKALAAKKQITLPDMMSEDGTECYQRLVKKTGSDFEKNYYNEMVERHEEITKS